MAQINVARELLKKQLIELSKDEAHGFSVGLEDESDFFKWRVCFEGPTDSLYEGGLFTAVLTLFHPNVYDDGRVCISILHPPGVDALNEQESADERWRPILSVESILISVISMLLDPNLNSPANLEAAKLFREDNQAWKKKVRQLTRKSVEG